MWLLKGYSEGGVGILVKAGKVGVLGFVCLSFDGHGIEWVSVLYWIFNFQLGAWGSQS